MVDGTSSFSARELTEVVLGREAEEYLRFYMGGKGDTLSQLALKRHLRGGVIFAYLPPDLGSRGVTEFERGGILENPELVDLAKRRLSMFVSGFLSVKPNRIAFFETYSSASSMTQMRVDLPYFTYRPTQYGSWDGTVGTKNEAGACVYMKSHDLDRFSVASLTCGVGRPDIGFLSSPSPATLKLLESQDELPGETLEDLARSVRHVVIPAHDGETYLIWSRAGVGD